MSRQNIYLLSSTLLLLSFIIIFSFTVLIPNGKSYRVAKTQLNSAHIELKDLQDRYTIASNELNTILSKNDKVLQAYKNSFDAKEFIEQNKKYFTSLDVSQISKLDDEDDFSVYKVDTVSNIHTPQNFYDFLDNISSSKWIILVNFPIEFKKDGELIISSFTMKVYNNKSITPPSN